MTASHDDYRLDRDWTAGVTGYPDPAIEVCDPRFQRCRLLPASIERLWTGGRWTEGPVWFGDARCLLFSDIPNERILCWSEITGAVTIWRSPSGCANGNTRDRRGRLITCEQDGRRVTRTEIDGTISVLIDRFEGRRLNGPNDVVVHPTDTSGSPIRATACCRTTKARGRPSSCPRGSIGSTRTAVLRAS